MKLLELFSGTRSIGTVAKKRGYDVVSLDLKNADINCDILQWNYKEYPTGYFDFIWSSPPCTEYSRAKTVGVRNIDEANAIVLKTLDTIEYFNPRIWFIENPQTGLLKNQEFMKWIPYKDVDYCKYGFNYRKRTRLWNNLYQWKPRELCNKDCNSMNGNRHKESAQRGSSRIVSGRDNNKHTQDELYRIPGKMIDEILNHTTHTQTHLTLKHHYHHHHHHHSFSSSSPRGSTAQS